MNSKSCGGDDHHHHHSLGTSRQQQQQHNSGNKTAANPKPHSAAASTDHYADHESTSASIGSIPSATYYAPTTTTKKGRRLFSSTRQMGGANSTTTTTTLKLESHSHFCASSRLLLFSVLAGWLLCSSRQLVPLPVCQAKVTQAHLSVVESVELMEGRLDTSQLCGTRYSQSQESDNNNLLYIVGGDQVEDEQFWPWSVAIYELDPLNGHKEFICSGSLISDRFILTAAHCIQQSRFDVLSAGEVFLKIAAVRLDDERAHFYRVSGVHIHPEYSVDRKANDIALLRLAANQRLPFRARPICLPSTLANRIDFTDQQVIIIGWGKTSAMHGDEPTRLVDIDDPGFGEFPIRQADDQDQLADQEFDTTSGGGGGGGGGSRRSRRRVGSGVRRAEEGAEEVGGASARDTQTNDTLLQAEVRVTNTDQCNRNYSKLEISWLNIDEHFLCASDPHGKRDACQGDSGGPLMWNNQQQQQQGQHGLAAANLQQFNNDQQQQQQRRRQQQQQQQVAEKWYQLGLVSFGHGCANSQFPGVYTRISYYMPWILRTISSSSSLGGRH